MSADFYSKTGNYILVVCPNPSIDIFAWLDKIFPGKTNRVTKEERYPGGKGVHVALALAELGEPVKLLGFWGGLTGSWIRSECEKRYASLKCIGPVTNGWSRSCYTFKSESEFDETEILGKGPDVTENDLRSFTETFNENVVYAKCIVLSGSWPQGAIGSDYQCLIDVANQHKKASFVDCTGDQLINSLKARPHTVHLNRSEFQDQFGGENPTKSLQLLLDQCEQVALSDGDKGLYLIEKNRTFHALSSVDLKHSAVGSGDCMMAGFAVAFSKSLDSVETAGLAASCGAANCLRHDLGMLFIDDVKLLYKNTQVKLSPGHPNFA